MTTRADWVNEVLDAGPGGDGPKALEGLRAWRDEYHDKVRQYLAEVGITFDDMAVSAPGAMFIIQEIHKQQQRRPPGVLTDATSGTFRILDMGLGFSTVAIQHYIASQELPDRFHYVGCDHSQEWLDFIASRVVGEHAMSHELVQRDPHDYKPAAWHADPFDVIILDHGPELQNRADDTPWLAGLLKPSGLLLFDDWRPKHEGRIRRALDKTPGEWTIGSAEWTRRTPRDKAIGWARRTA